ncbi:glutathione binding-like protein [Salinicola sp. RZ23]|uniref:glutathione S-transferase family protein n=1 Tax=Salinicola sp. RZ23 TaxID=1949087 RepID=UPI000DA1185E|nr:glutathione binding-like protein [Salinicola sp. RZ23]
MADLKLFYAPGACSLASHIALEEVGAEFEAVRIDTAAGEQRSADYLRINPKGRVPALAVGETVITENPAILRYVSQRFPESVLWPSTLLEDARCAEWLAFLASGVHPIYAHVRRPERYATGDAAKADVVETARRSTRELFEMIEARLAERPDAWALGERYSVADAYLFVFWQWGAGAVLGYDMASDFPAWSQHARRMLARPAVGRALAREGLDIPTP